ncbi:hypothetical protein [Mesobacillus subterraneus]|uniref:Uncharacterized protein n=1 Tax=Mesobacillus subterraneus TaxID=285983 RepID=A0A3R9E7E8_9BACI|nr:hypothetical protein [Mesobacillus subterraneus]RSD27800.1 hypothetical protein EJA10_08475 [Mesobacillus subterraneus]
MKWGFVMNCGCDSVKDLTLQRNDISKRIKESKMLKKRFRLIAKHSNGEEKLYVCNECNQLWQGSYAWNFGNGEYLFKIPSIEIKKWEVEHYTAPDEILMYLALMDRFLTENTFVASEENCRKENCNNKAVKGLNLCLEHHIKSLQYIGNLPKTPKGKLSDPYGQIYRKYKAIFDEAIMLLN